MKYRLIYSTLITTIAACLLLPPSACASPQKQRPVSSKQALQIAKVFVGAERAQELSFDKLAVRNDFPPFASAYHFRCQLEQTDEAGKPYTATVIVEKNTGRVLGYETHFLYKHAKNKGKKKPGSEEMISLSQAQAIAMRAFGDTSIPSENMQLTGSELADLSQNDMEGDPFYVYSLCFSKLVDDPEVGKIQLPVTASFLLDAVTGELYKYIYKERPVVISFAVPQVSKEQAVEVVKERAQRTGVMKVTEVADVRLAVGFNLDNLTSEESRLRSDDPARFYETVEMKRQTLAWKVILKGTHSSTDDSVKAEAFVDSQAGSLFGLAMPISAL